MSLLMVGLAHGDSAAMVEGLLPVPLYPAVGQGSPMTLAAPFCLLTLC